MLAAEEDRPPYVMFETRAIEDRNKSIEAGYYVSRDVNYALVTPPGSKDCHEEELDAWLARAKMNARNGRLNPRWVELWEEKAKSWKAGQEIPEEGMPIKGWTMLSPAQCESLLAANIRTVEDLAQINDEGLMRFGMGGIELKKKAQACLQATKDHGPLTAKVTALEQDNVRLTTQNESLALQVKQLKAQIETGVTLEVVPTPPKEKISAADILDAPSELETLREQYEQKMGKKPHHLMKEAGLRKALGE